MRLTVESRSDVAIFLAAAALIVAGFAFISPPVALVVAGALLLASLIDRRRRP